jgi:GTP pyrophosphokinase
VEKHLSNAQVDRLGDRLRRQDFGEAELRSLDEYRLTFGPAYDRVVEAIRRVIGLPVSGRPAKSTTSIIEKLNRESIRLSQMQDIAGCRAVVDDVGEQNRTVEAIAAVFKDVAILDRRLKPSHGYRAVHLIVREDNKVIEVQIRTALQHVWAEMCEKFADVSDPALKYGGGPEHARDALAGASRVIEDMEAVEAGLARASGLERAGVDVDAIAQGVRAMRNAYLNTLQSLLNEPIEPD